MGNAVRTETPKRCETVPDSEQCSGVRLGQTALEKTKRPLRATDWHFQSVDGAGHFQTELPQARSASEGGARIQNRKR